MRRGRFGMLAAAAAVVVLLAGCRSGAGAAGESAGGPSPAASAVPGPSLLAGRTRGSARAPVTVYEFSDFQCPFCRRFAEVTYPALDSAYVAPGRVRWVFINSPRPIIHPNSRRAAEYAVCARAQGRFWQLHDRLFAEQSRWAPLANPDSALVALAAQAGLDPRKLAACLRGPSTEAELAEDSAFAASVPMAGVPAFVSDGHVVVLGAESLAVFRAALDSLLSVRTR